MRDKLKIIIPIVVLIIAGIIVAIINIPSKSNKVVKNENNETEITHKTVVKAYELNDKSEYDTYEVTKYEFSTDDLYEVYKNDHKIQSSKICNFKTELTDDVNIDEISSLSYNNLKLNDYLISENTYSLDRNNTFCYLSKCLNNGSVLIRLIETAKYIDCYLLEADGSYLRIVNNSEVTIIKKLDNIDSLRDIVDYVV